MKKVINITDILVCPRLKFNQITIVITGGERSAVQGVRGAAEGGDVALPDDAQ